MAKPIAHRPSNETRTSRLPPIDGRVVNPVVFWAPPKGINNLARLSQVAPEFAVSINNLMLNEGHLRSRYGNESLGSPDNRVQAIMSFTPADGAGVLLRIRTDGVDSWNGSTWLPVVDIILTGNVTDRFTWTGWGNELLICNGADKIISYNVVTGEVTILDESSPARHLSSFNGRVIASAVTDGAFYGYRIRWSEKLDNRQWIRNTTVDAIGSGYEDLLATPGGVVDEVMGTFPLSDETSLVVRENSLWLMLVTGQVDAPFRFSRLTNEIGSRARRGIALSPFGVIVPSHEDVIIVDQSGPKSIGSGIRRELFASIDNFTTLIGAYDPRRQEYRLVNGDEAWRYNFRDQGWTHDTYDVPLRHMSFVGYKSLGLTYDQLTGTFDQLQGTFDDLSIPAADEGMHSITDNNGLAIREDPDLTDDNTVPVPIEIVSGLLAAASILDRTGIIEAQLEYECEEAQRVYFDYSLDKGTTWIQYSYTDLLPTTGPKITAVRKTLEHHNIQFKARSLTLGKLSLISLALFIVKGARVNQ